MTQQIKSKKRVADHGEVFTREQEVNAMLDLVKAETIRVDASFLEPACGTGNFLIEILKRKLGWVEEAYRKSQREYEFYALFAVAQVYGIELLEDNVIACRARLLNYVEQEYRRIFAQSLNEERLNLWRENINAVLTLNIVHGNALTMTYEDRFDDWGNPQMLRFCQWKDVKLPMHRKGTIQRQVYEYQHLIEHEQSYSYHILAEDYLYFLDIKNAKPIN